MQPLSNLPRSQLVRQVLCEVNVLIQPPGALFTASEALDQRCPIERTESQSLKAKNKGDINFTNIFSLTQHIQNITIQTCSQHKT